MTFPPGTECYNADRGTIRARGHRWQPAELTTAARSAVADSLFDRPGMAEDREFLLSLGATGFAAQRVDEVLGAADVQQAVEQWRVGEAVAQAELEAHRSCSFPWNIRRDLKNPRASHAGAELVGFHRRAGGGQCFAFGEVKTSSQIHSPPSVNTDLRRQLRALHGDRRVVDNLVRYLAPRARAASWRDDFKQAWQAFCTDRRDYAIFGVLVRDTEPPDPRDLSGMATDLSVQAPPPPSVELRALYFPAGRIRGLADAEAVA
jgi:hypothetical protein